MIAYLFLPLLVASTPLHQRAVVRTEHIDALSSACPVVKELQKADFEKQFQKKSKPVIVQNVSTPWLAPERWTPTSLTAWRDELVTIDDGLHPASQVYHNFTLGDFIDQVEAGNPGNLNIHIRGGARKLGGWNDRKVPDAFVNVDWSPFIIIGGAGMSNHFHGHDETHVTLVHGRKIWFIAPPGASGSELETQKTHPCDYLKPGVMKRMQKSGALPQSLMVCVQHAGETMWFPREWQHAVCSSEWSLGVGGQGRLDVESRDRHQLHLDARLGELTLITNQGKSLPMHELTARDTEGDTPLHIAAEFGQAAMVKQLVSRRVDLEVSAPRREGTPLHLAAHNSHLAVVKVLLSARAHVDARTDSGWTALHKAFQKGNVSIVKQLLKAKANPSLKCESEWNALHLAATSGHAPLVHLAVERNSKDMLRSQDEFGHDALWHSAYKGHAAVAKALLQLQADVHAAVTDGKTALHTAAEYGHALVAERLLSARADPETVDDEGASFLHTAASQGHLSLVELAVKHTKEDVLHSVDKQGLDPLLHAARGKHQPAVKRLLALRADLNKQTSSKPWTVMHIVAETGDLSTAKLLVRARARVGLKGHQGETPLHVATYGGHLSVAKLLIAQGASVKAKDRNGNRAIDLVGQAGHQQLEDWQRIFQMASSEL